MCFRSSLRELLRLRIGCIEGEGAEKCDVESLTMQRFDRLLTKIPEHSEPSVGLLACIVCIGLSASALCFWWFPT